MKIDLSRRLGFLLNEVGRLYGRSFDQLARQQLCLSRAQCRLLAVLSAHPDRAPWSQVALAEELDLSPMAVATLCDRMEAAGWIRRVQSTSDRRVNELVLEPKAQQALITAMDLGDALQDRALAGFSSAETDQFMGFLQRAGGNLQAPADPLAESGMEPRGPSRRFARHGQR